MGPGTAIGAGVASGTGTLPTMSAKLVAGVPAGGNGGAGYCARARAANVKKERASTAANRPPRRLRGWLPAMELLSEYGVSSIHAIQRGCP